MNLDGSNYHNAIPNILVSVVYYRGKKVVAVASMNYDPVVAQAAEMLLNGKDILKDDVK